MSDVPTVGIDASRSYRFPMTGTERYSRCLVEQLVTLREPGFKLRLFFNEAPPEDAPLENADRRILPARRFWTHYRLSREMRNNPVDLLFVPSHVLPLVHPDRSIVTVHDLGYLVEPDSHPLSSRVQLRLTTRWNVRRASHIVAVSKSTRRDLIERLDVDPGRITVVPHGVDVRFQVRSSSEIERYRRAARLPDQFVLYLGTIQPRKNLARLITAFERCAARNEQVHLVLAGRTGWLSDEIRERADASLFRERIRFLGYVPDAQLPLLYGAASVFAFPSLYEGFGLPVLEALACGIPVVVSNRGALPEVAGADSLIVEPENIDQLEAALVELPLHRHAEGRIAERVSFARKFTWQGSARRTRDLFLEHLP